jgi:hypothetical protein
MQETPIERNFWRFWLSGLLLFAVMLVLNVALSNSVAAFGISDHQAAGTAVRVNAIHDSWKATGVFNTARISMMIDLVFIGVYAWGAYSGGQAMRQNSGPVLQRLGATISVAAVLFALTDFAETICQLIQIMRDAGSDNLAAYAAVVRPFKTVFFLITFVGLLVALFLRRKARRSA